MQFDSHLAKSNFFVAPLTYFQSIRLIFQTFNLDSCASEIQPVAAWSAKAIEQCRKLFSDDNAVRVCYDIKQQHHEYLFGDLYIHVLPKNSPQTRSVHIGQALTSIKQAVEVDFKKGTHIFTICDCIELQFIEPIVLNYCD